jgi:hypothetical protein
MQVIEWSGIIAGAIALVSLIWHIVNTIIDKMPRVKLSISAGTITRYPMFGDKFAEELVIITCVNIGRLPVTIEEGGLIYPLWYTLLRPRGKMQRFAFTTKIYPKEELAFYKVTLNYGDKVEYYAYIDSVKQDLLKLYGRRRCGLRYYVRDSTDKYHKRCIPRWVINKIFEGSKN